MYMFVQYVNRFCFLCAITAKMEAVIVVIYPFSVQSRFVLSSRRRE
jgi:hypothetical protein